MRQKFDIGDLVLVNPPVDKAGVIVETKLLNAHLDETREWYWHHDEYSCKVQFLNSTETTWIRAKMLSHLSKIS